MTNEYPEFLVLMVANQGLKTWNGCASQPEKTQRQIENMHFIVFDQPCDFKSCLTLLEGLTHSF